MRRISLTKKFLLGLAALELIAGVAVYPQTAAAIGINHQSVVTGKTVTAGDIFSGLPDKADKVIGPAPLPGEEMVLNSRTLLRIALALDLPWRPESSMDYVVVKSAATIVEKDTIESALKSALEAKGISGNYKLILDGEAVSMALPHGTAPTVEVSSLDVKSPDNGFEATLAAPSTDNPLATAKISGRIVRMATVPVLRTGLNNGTIIGERDIDFIDIPEKSLNGDIILKKEDLMGMTPRRVVLSGQPVQFNDIESPRMVSRGDIVTMIFNEGTLQLTAQGKALENGARGDKIRVVNTSSSKTILAQVTNNKEVTLTE